MDPLSTARGVATHVLHRVQKDGAWATPTLDAELKRRKLSDRDAGLATAIVYGALRVLPELDRLLDAHIQRSGEVDAWARAAMRVAAFQIQYMDRIPVRAAVHEAVELVKAKRGRLGGFANAVLRKLKRPETRPTVRLVLPPWLDERLERAVGAERAMATRSAEEPGIDLRAVDRDALQSALEVALPEARVSAGRHFETVHVAGGGDPRSWPGYAEGRFSVQEQGAQIIGHLVDAQPGERILDACAGRGGKTVQLAQRLGADGQLTAVDLHEARLEQIQPAFDRVSAEVQLTIEPIDWKVGDGGLPGGFDRVLVDAPCSGLGTLHRRPEILLRLTPEDLTRLAETQFQILSRVAALVRPGGVLVYAVCSFAPEEGPAVVERFLAETPGFELKHVESSLCPADPDGIIRLGPWWDGCDGYQIAMLGRI